MRASSDSMIGDAFSMSIVLTWHIQAIVSYILIVLFRSSSRDPENLLLSTRDLISPCIPRLSSLSCTCVFRSILWFYTYLIYQLGFDFLLPCWYRHANVIIAWTMCANFTFNFGISQGVKPGPSWYKLAFVSHVFFLSRNSVFWLSIFWRCTI